MRRARIICLTASDTAGHRDPTKTKPNKIMRKQLFSVLALSFALSVSTTAKAEPLSLDATAAMLSGALLVAGVVAAPYLIAKTLKDAVIPHRTASGQSASPSVQPATAAH
jgi:hypothetical protein